MQNAESLASVKQMTVQLTPEMINVGQAIKHVHLFSNSAIKAILFSRAQVKVHQLSYTFTPAMTNDSMVAITAYSDDWQKPTSIDAMIGSGSRYKKLAQPVNSQCAGWTDWVDSPPDDDISCGLAVHCTHNVIGTQMIGYLTGRVVISVRGYQSQVVDPAPSGDKRKSMSMVS